MGNDSIIAFKTREQLRKYLGIFSPQFKGSRWKMEFLGQMLFGIQAARDTLMSEIARSLQEDILAKKTQERLERHLAADGMDAKIHGSILCDAAPGIGERTLVIVDPSDVQKEYAEKMPYLAKVWDGSRGRVGDNLGYTLCMAIACENGCRKIVPLMLRLWSTVHPEYVSENDEVEQVIGQIASATNGKGIFVYDRGGDGDGMFGFYIRHGLDFIVRLVGDRNLLNWGGKTKDSQVLARKLAGQRPVQVPQQGPQRPREVRLDARAPPGLARHRPASRRREVAWRRKAHDAADDAERGAHAQGPVGGGAGVHDPLEGRGHDTVHQAVLQARAHEAPRLPAAEEHGGARGGGGVLRGCVAREEGQAGRVCQACRQGFAQDVRGAGVLLLRNRGRS